MDAFGFFDSLLGNLRTCEYCQSQRGGKCWCVASLKFSKAVEKSDTCAVFQKADREKERM